MRWVRINANARWKDGRIPSSARSCATRRTCARAEETVRETEERYRRLVEGAHDYALHTLDEQGRVTGWNPGAQRLFGWSSEEIQGHDFGSSFTPEDRADDVPERMLRLAVDEGRFLHEGWRVRKDGTRFGAEVLYTALRDPSGRLLEVSQLTRDITERQRLEALRKKSTDLEIANRQVVELAQRSASLIGAVAEAVEGPLRTIEAEAARLGAADPQRVRSLKEGVSALRHAVRDLDELAAVEAGGSGVAARERRPGPAGRRDARPPPARPPPSGACAWRPTSTPTLAGVDADPVRLRQVVYNLLSNGIKFSRERGRVSLRMLPEGEAHFRVEVEDSGIGLSPDEVDQLLRGSDEGAAEGEAEGEPPTGAPVSASRRRAASSSSRAAGSASTARPGAAACSSPCLPRSPGRARLDAAAQAEPAGPRRVLALSEDSSTRAGIAWTLGSVGFEITAAMSSEEALDVSRENRFDVVIVRPTARGHEPRRSS